MKLILWEFVSIKCVPLTHQMTSTRIFQSQNYFGRISAQSCVVFACSTGFGTPSGRQCFAHILLSATLILLKLFLGRARPFTVPVRVLFYHDIVVVRTRVRHEVAAPCCHRQDFPSVGIQKRSVYRKRLFGNFHDICVRVTMTLSWSE